jgi:hypothetical protein
MASVKTKFNLGAVEAKVKAKVRDNMAAAALFVQGEGTKSLNRGGRSKVSVRSRVEVRDKEVIGVISAENNDARALEMGTPKVQPQPFLRPALLNSKRTILSLLRRK